MAHPALTQEQFLQKAKAVHGDKYDFSKAVYTVGNNKVCVICPTHGEFLIAARNLLSGAGCRACARAPKYNTESFIAKAQKIHGDTYDYSLVKYTRMKDKVDIICKKHGVFSQQAVKHILRKHGCPICANDIRTTKDWFLERSNEVHGDTYNYGKVVYKNIQSKVTITCPIHGDFEQIAANHLKGCGCPICARENTLPSKGEELIAKFLDENNIKYHFQYDIITKKLARNSNLIRVDFALKKNNHIYIIEYNGK